MQAVFEVFNAEKKLQIQNWTPSGQVSKIHDRFVKSDVLSLASNAKLQAPRSLTRASKISYPYLILQIFIPSGRPFSLELLISDSSCSKKKISFTQTKSISKTSNSARIPQQIFQKDTWNNLCIDLPGLMKSCFSSPFNCIEGIQVSGNCRVKLILGCKLGLRNSSEGISSQLSLLAGYELPIKAISQVIDYRSLSIAEGPFSDKITKKSRNFLSKSPQRNLGFENKKRLYTKEMVFYDNIIRKQLGPKHLGKCNP